MKTTPLFKIMNQLVMIVFLASGLLAACAPKATPSAAPPQETQPTTAPEATQPSTEPIKLVIWTAYGKQLQSAVDAYNAKMRAEGKNIEVTGTELAFESISDKFAVAVTTGDVPDILDLDLVLAPGFTSKGAMLDITDWVNQAGLKDDFNPKFLDLGVWDDKIYMIPFSADVSVLYYNTDIFQKVGLDPAKKIETWDEFRDALLAIKQADLKTDAGL
ncbi:MAG TPA: extracellular solute-binding protein, partial [Anaerolineales bacterium]